MTGTPNARIPADLTLHALDDTHAMFAGWLRAEPLDRAAAGFGIEGGLKITRRIDRDSWESLGSPVVLPVTLYNVSAGQ